MSGTNDKMLQTSGGSRSSCANQLAFRTWLIYGPCR